MPAYIYGASNHTINNRAELARSQVCGCYYCLHIFKPLEIVEWIPQEDGKEFPMCPRCGIDAVFGDASGYPVRMEFLRQMNRYWFDGDGQIISDSLGGVSIEAMPSKRQAAIEKAYVIVDEITAGKRDVVEGAKALFWSAFDEYDFTTETKKYVYDSIGLEKAYGLLDSCTELPDADHQWQKNKTNDELLIEARTGLLNELTAWRLR